MQGGEDLRPSVSRSASHVRDSFESEGSARDGHHDTVRSHHVADDVSLHARDAAEFMRGSRCAQQAAVTVSSATSGKQKRAKIAPSGYWDGWNLKE
jgi:hypothetical protein